MTATSTTTASHHPTQTGNGRQARPQPTAATTKTFDTVRLDIAREFGRRLLADADALQAEPYAPDHSGRRIALYGRAQGVLQELLDELDRIYGAQGGAR